MTVLGSRFWVRGSGSRFRALGVAARCLSALRPVQLRPRSAAARSPTAAFDAARAYEHLRQVVGFGPRPAGSPAHRAHARLHHRAAENARHSRGPAGVRREDAHRRDSMVNLDRHDSGRAEGADCDHRPLRHEAVSRVPVRRRQRRRIEHGVPDRAGAGAEGPPQCLHDRADFLRRRRSDAAGLGRQPTTPMAASTTSTARARRHAVDA